MLPNLTKVAILLVVFGLLSCEKPPQKVEPAITIKVLNDGRLITYDKYGYVFIRVVVLNNNSFPIRIVPGHYIDSLLGVNLSTKTKMYFSWCDTLCSQKDIGWDGMNDIFPEPLVVVEPLDSMYGYFVFSTSWVNPRHKNFVVDFELKYVRVCNDLDSKYDHHLQYREKRGPKLPKDSLDCSAWYVQNILFPIRMSDEGPILVNMDSECEGDSSCIIRKYFKIVEDE